MMRFHSLRSRRVRPAAALPAALLALGLSLSPAAALSELPQEDVPAQPPVTSVPLPPPIANPSNPTAAPQQAPAGEDGKSAPAGETPPAAAQPEEGEQPAAATETPEVLYDLSQLPEPVRALRDKLVAIAKAGDIEALRPLIATGDEGTMLSLGDSTEDPITFLKGLSGDGEGYEILAILEEVLEAGYVHLEPGAEGEMYVWPYFFAVPLDSLTAPQRVELFRIVTAGDYEDMKQYGAYVFYRVGITPDGHWSFFVAGD